MKERGKSVETCRNFPDYDASEIPCKQHPDSSSHVGICPHCLRDRLVRLVCSECGKRRVSSCSCSDNMADVGSVGRISFLIDSEKRKNEGSERLIFFRRSNSSCVEEKKSNGFWGIKRLFRKRSRGFNGGFCDVNSEICSFRDNDFKISDGSSGVFLDCPNQIEIDSRVCIVPNRSVFPIKECDLSDMDESEFFDLNLESKQEIINGSGSDHDAIGGNLASLEGKRVYKKGGSCRITMNERGLRQRITRNYNVWRWFFKDA